MKFKNGKKEFMIDCDNNNNVTLKLKTDAKKVIKVDGQKVETDEYIYDILGYFNSVEQCFKMEVVHLTGLAGNAPGAGAEGRLEPRNPGARGPGCWAHLHPRV